MMLMMKVFLWVKHRPLSVSFLIHTSGKDPHSQAGSGRYNIYWRLSDPVEEHFLRECFFKDSLHGNLTKYVVVSFIRAQNYYRELLQRMRNQRILE